MMRGWLVWIVLAGCVEARLTPCGDVYCGPGSVCVAASMSCADERLAVPCDGLTQDDACVAPGVVDGTCQEGLCVQVACGNGVLEVDEVCDDGNNRSGDGCRSDCQTERCGDGVLDPGEFCDCGVVSTPQPAGCLGPNSNDPAAQCDMKCFSHCGDGMVTGLEECDGASLGGATCQSIGFYYGDALACGTQCKFDVSTCSGACGDGVVQPDQAEDCDGAPPAASCVDYGFDSGHVGCTARCAANVIQDCDRFGWHTIRTNVASQAWSDGTRIATIENQVGAYFDGATWMTATSIGVYDHLADNGTIVAFVGRDRTVRQLTGAAFETVLNPQGSVISDADLLSDGRRVLTRADNLIGRVAPHAHTLHGPFATTATTAVNDAGGSLAGPGPVNFTCTVEVEGTPWRSYPSRVGQSCDVAILPGDVPILVTTSGAVFRGSAANDPTLTWTSLGQVVVGGGMQIRRIDDQVWIAAGNLYSVGAVTGLTLVRTGAVISVTGGAGVVYASTGSSLDRFDGSWVVLSVPSARIAGRGALLLGHAAGATQMLAVGAGDVGEPLPVTARRTIRLPDATVAVAVNRLDVTSPSGWQSVLIANNTLLDAWGAGRADFWVAGSQGVRRLIDLVPTVALPGTVNATAIDGRLTDGGTTTQLVAVISSGTAIIEAQIVGVGMPAMSSTVASPQGCTFADVVIDNVGTVFATGSCASIGVVWKVTGATAEELHRVSLRPLQRLITTGTGRVVVVGDAGVIEVTATTPTTVTPLRALSTADVAMVGNRLHVLDTLDANNLAALHDWDGATWAPVRIAPGGWRWLSAGDDRLVVGRSTQVRRLIEFPPVPAALMP